jgi:hypothetical protein
MPTINARNQNQKPCTNERLYHYSGLSVEDRKEGEEKEASMWAEAAEAKVGNSEGNHQFLFKSALRLVSTKHVTVRSEAKVGKHTHAYNECTQPESESITQMKEPWDN